MNNTKEGHRKRLRNKFLQSGLRGFLDYEIIELLLTLGTPRKDCKGMAKELIKKFGSLRKVLEAPPEELQQIKGIGKHNIFGLKIVQEVARIFLKEKIIKKEIKILKCAKDVFNYLFHSMRDLTKECFKVIYLDIKNRILDIEDLFEGTVDASSIYQREIIKNAIKHNAVSLIFVHNHPSGDITPSESDKNITEELVFMGNIVQIKVLDHIIIGENKYYSFAEAGLIDKYNLDYLELKKSYSH